MLILNANLHVSFLSEYELPRWNEYWGEGKLKTWTVDILIIDQRYWNGVLEINGSIHDNPSVARSDAHKRRFIQKLGLWFEELENEDVSEQNIRAILNRHLRRVDDYNNPL